MSTTDVFVAADRARQKLAEATDAYADCKTESTDDYFKRLTMRTIAAERTDIRRRKRDDAIQSCRDDCERRIRCILDQANADINGIAADLKKLESERHIDDAIMKARLAGCAEHAAVARQKSVVAGRLAESIRLLDLLKYRSFLRLQSNPASADRLVRWIDKYVRPDITGITVIDPETMRYEVRSVSGYIVVKLRPIAKLTHIDGSFMPIETVRGDRPRTTPSLADASILRPSNGSVVQTTSADVDIRTRNAPWLADPPTADLFSFGRFVLLYFLTSACGDCRNAVADQQKASKPNWLRLAERDLLRMDSLRPPKERSTAGLLERWMPGLPSDLVRLVLLYDCCDDDRIVLRPTVFDDDAV